VENVILNKAPNNRIKCISYVKNHLLLIYSITNPYYHYKWSITNMYLPETLLILFLQLCQIWSTQWFHSENSNSEMYTLQYQIWIYCTKFCVNVRWQKHVYVQIWPPYKMVFFQALHTECAKLVLVTANQQSNEILLPEYSITITYIILFSHRLNSILESTVHWWRSIEK
jgi:hypothetical protein